MPRYSCGCVNEVHSPSGVLHSVVKCKKHRAGMRDPATLDESYYTELGLIRDGRFLPTKHLEELTEALGAIPSPPLHGEHWALEIGCGISPYAFAIEGAGWSYLGIDVSPWAVGFMNAHHDSLYVRYGFEQFERPFPHGLILAAHCIEHMEDAPGAIAKCARLLEPGGEFWIIVPDDSDPVNPDHLFFFTEATLRSTLESAGLVVDRMAVRKYVKHENFLYARARKPA